MKKLLIAILITLGSFSLVSADIGVNIGVSASLGEYEATGSETENAETSGKHKEKMLGGMGSYFIEKELTFLFGLLKRLSVGYDKVVHKISTGTKDTSRTESETSPGVNTTVNNKVSADIDNIRTIYATLRITDWLYLKTGSMKMDVSTTESLDTGSAYPDTNLEGDMTGFGVVYEADNGMFLRAEYTDTDIDGKTLTSTTNADNTVTLDGVEGDQARISIGKAF